VTRANHLLSKISPQKFPEGVQFPTISLWFTGHVLDRNYRGPAKSGTLLASLTNPAYRYHFKHPRGYEQRFDQLDQIERSAISSLMSVSNFTIPMPTLGQKFGKVPQQVVLGGHGISTVAIWIRRIVSFCVNIFVNLKGSLRGDAVKDGFYQVRKKIDDIRQTFPEGVVGPFFNESSATPTSRSMQLPARTSPTRS
jgi:hypothetical protein